MADRWNWPLAFHRPRKGGLSFSPNFRKGRPPGTWCLSCSPRIQLPSPLGTMVAFVSNSYTTDMPSYFGTLATPAPCFKGPWGIRGARPPGHVRAGARESVSTHACGALISAHKQFLLPYCPFLSHRISHIRIVGNSPSLTSARRAASAEDSPPGAQKPKRRTTA